MFYNLASRYQRWRHAPGASKTPVAPLFASPLPRSGQRICDTRFLVVDCEMSGLDPKSCQLLSIGWVLVEHCRMISASSRHLLIHAEKGTGDSTRIHGLHETRIAGAKSAAAVLMLLIKQMQGAVLVFHHAPLDIQFLQKSAMENFRCPLFFSYVDTMAIEKQRAQLQGKQSGLRLAQCRERYGLQLASQHNALADAQATAELLLAQISYLGSTEKARLSRLGLACAT